MAGTKRGAAVVAVAVAVAVAAVGLREGAGPAAVPAVAALGPSQVRRLVVESGGQRAELARGRDAWSPGPGTPPFSAALLFSAEDRLLPLLAYRAVAADPADPQYGLVEPALALRLEGGGGEEVGVHFGAASFTGAGFYARRLGEAGRLYLVPRHTMDLLRSLVSGEQVGSADPLEDRTRRYQAGQQRAEADKDMTTYLRQVLDAGGRMPPEVQ